MAPVWGRLVTWPLMRRPHMYQTRPNHGCRTGLQQCCSTSILKDNGTTGCTNVETPCKYSVRMGDKTTSAVIHRCYLQSFMNSWPDSRLLSELSFNVIFFNEHLFLFWPWPRSCRYASISIYRFVPRQGVMEDVVVASAESARIVWTLTPVPFIVLWSNVKCFSRSQGGTLNECLSESLDHNSRPRGILSISYISDCSIADLMLFYQHNFTGYVTVETFSNSNMQTSIRLTFFHTRQSYALAVTSNKSRDTCILARKKRNVW